MKRIALLALCCLVLGGCGRNEAKENAPVETAAQVNAMLDAGRAASADGSLTAHAIPEGERMELFSLNGDVVLVLYRDTGTVLHSLSGAGQFAAGPELDVTDCRVRADAPDRVVCFARGTGELLLLDESLREAGRIQLPEDNVGTPMLSADGSTVYYVSVTGIRAMDTVTGIPAMRKESSGSGLTIQNLAWQDALLVCSDGQRTMLRHADDGTQEFAGDFPAEFTSRGEQWFWHSRQDGMERIAFGVGAQARELFPTPGEQFLAFLGEYALTAKTENDCVSLRCYDLSSGMVKAETAAEGYGDLAFPVLDGKGSVCILAKEQISGETVLLRWNMEASPMKDSLNYTDTFFRAASPDQAGLALCYQKAEEMHQRYGIQVKIHTDAVQVQPWDYSLETEFRPYVIRRELAVVEHVLSHYPDGFLNTLAENFTSVNLCIVSSIRGTPESGSLDTAQGLQFWEGGDGFIALQAGGATDYNLCHELSHLIDTQVINHCNAYDDWDALNPEGFAYNEVQDANAAPGSSYLYGETRAFIDAYAMTAAAEDRARIMEYAMNPGNAAYFDPPAMQEKLRRLCVGIRKAFDLTQSPEAYLWEQYLWNSITWAVNSK